MTDLITTQDNSVDNLPQLELEIKFYLGQTAQNIIEVGKRLIQAKSLVKHGDWQAWLEKNFSLKQSTAYNFMACANKFRNFQSIGSFNSTQLITLLALPNAEETEKFIEQKAAEGKQVADMTIKQLRAEIASYKADHDKLIDDYSKKLDSQKKAYQQELFDLSEDFKQQTQSLEKDLQEKVDDIAEQLADAKKELADRPVVAPQDYQLTKDTLALTQIELGKVQAKLELQAEDFKTQTATIKEQFDAKNSALQKENDKLKKANERLNRKFYTAVSSRLCKKKRLAVKLIKKRNKAVVK